MPEVGMLALAEAVATLASLLGMGVLVSARVVAAAMLAPAVKSAAAEPETWALAPEPVEAVVRSPVSDIKAGMEDVPPEM
ncbi:MAG: hypothetical protein ACRC6N_05320 [Plesiomonas sp.]|uniref:hypothetical protein n=1 Tax=Plesiomonas sp. TaxID=2486279 RepID=UPI003F2CCE5F